MNFSFASVIANGVFPLFSGYTGTLSTAQFATLSYPTSMGSASFSLQNNPGEVDLVISGGKDSLLWKGPAGGGTPGSGDWDTSTMNWSSLGSPSTYADDKIVTFNDNANGTGTLTVNINNGGTSVKPYIVIFDNSAKSYIINGTAAGDVIGGSAALVKNGTGSVTFNRVQTYTGDTTVNAGTINYGATGGLSTSNLIINDTGTVNVTAGGTTGSGSVTLNAGGTLSVNAASALSSASSVNISGGTLQYGASFATGINPNVTASSTIDTGGNSITFNGAVSTPSNPADTQLTKTGSGSLTLATAAPNYHGGWAINGGSVIVSYSDSSGITGLGTSSTHYNTDSVFVNSGELKLANVTVGDITGATTNSPEIVMGDGSTLTATGATTIVRSYGLDLVPGSATPVSAKIQTASSSDTLDVNATVRQFSSSSSAADTTIHVAGSGTMILHHGAVSSAYTYSGNWAVDGGMLQVGPVIPDPTPGAYAGPYGEPLNALGFVNGDPDSPNTVTVNSGGILAVAVDAPNTNPNITSSPTDPTPDYLRTSVVLSGGALAATGSEVSYDPSPTGPQGVSTGVKVTARFGGDLTVNAGTSKILTYNPAIPSETRTVQLVGGSRTITSGTITYNTNWNGNLEVDPGTSGGGEFDIIRDAGNVSVTPGATLTVDAGATVVLGGAADTLSDGTNHVNVVNNSTTTFHVTQGTKNIGTLTGVGNTIVDAGVTLNTNGITQNTLNVADGGKATVRARTGTPLVSNNRVSYINNLNLNSSGTLDTNDNDLVVNNGVFSTIRSLVSGGYSATPDTAKTGIISTAGQNSGGKTILALFDNALVGDASWDGHTISANAVVGKYTYYGDVNLDGQVTGDDYSAVDSNLGSTGLNAGNAWLLGDTNGDLSVTGDDYSSIDANLGLGVGNPLAVASVSAVPEPASLGLIGLGAMGFLARRRRRRQSQA